MDKRLEGAEYGHSRSQDKRLAGQGKPEPSKWALERAQSICNRNGWIQPEIYVAMMHAYALEFDAIARERDEAARKLVVAAEELL